LSLDATVLAVIPCFDCDPWLDQCLRSLTAQTRPLDGIVVVDDASGRPPIEITSRYPTVTLLASSENVGPFALLQEVIRATAYDGYLLQDADDWSAVDRLELQLGAACASGAELVGSQELRVRAGQQGLSAVCYPLDVNEALKDGPANALLNGASLLARGLVMRLGGFASGLRFGADTEFLFRAHHAGRIVNVPYFSYFRRMHRGSLTANPLTGMGSPPQEELASLLEDRARENVRRVRSGQGPILTPHCVRPIPHFRHLCGPPLIQGPTAELQCAGASDPGASRSAKPRT
jgi:glycosyltransferase involved in cell wall biosynthesis